MATVVNREAPYSGLANLMAMRGRMGDTELVHMSPSEIKGLASLGQLTVNPDTGLPEAFKLKSLLPTIAGIGAAVATGGTSLLIPAVATGLTSAVVNKDIGRGLFDGLLSYAGGSIMRGLSGGGEAFGELAKPAAATVTTATPSAAASKAAQEFTAAQMAQVSPTAASAMSAGLPVGGPAIPAGGMLAPFPASSGIGSMVPGGLTPSVPLTTSISPAAGTFTAVKDITPSFVGRQLGYETIKQGATLTPMQVAQLGGGTAGLTTSQMAGLYAPQAIAGVGGSMLQDAMTPEYQQPELLSGTVSTPRTPRTITRTPLRSTPVTEEEALGAALGTGPALRFSDYTTRYANQGGLVGYATGGGIRPVESAGEPSNDPQANVGTGVVGNVNVTDPVDIGLGAFNPSPLSLGLGLVGLAMGVPGLGLASSMIDTPNVNALGQTQAYGYGNQSIDAFGNTVGTTQSDMSSMSAAPATVGVTPGLQDPMGVFGDFTSSGDGVSADSDMGGMSGVDGSEEGAAGGFESGGLIAMLQRGGLLSPTQNPSYFEGVVPGTAHGMKDNVAFKVQGGSIDTAMLSPGEYVVPADVVSMLGNGNGDSGAKQLDVFAKNIRQKAFGTEKQQKQINAPKELGQLATA